LPFAGVLRRRQQVQQARTSDGNSLSVQVGANSKDASCEDTHFKLPHNVKATSSAYLTEALASSGKSSDC